MVQDAKAGLSQVWPAGSYFAKVPCLAGRNADNPGEALNRVSRRPGRVFTWQWRNFRL